MSRVDSVGLARQTAGMGTEVTTMEYFVPVETSSVNDNATQLTIQETIGTRFAVGLDYGTRFFDVPMAGSPRAASFPRVLSGFLGQPETSGGGPYDHLFDPVIDGKVPEPHSIFAVRNDPVSAGQDPIVDLFWDARGNQLDINIAANDYVKMSAAWIALDLDDAQPAPTATYDSSKRFKFTQVLVEWSSDGGATFEAVLASAAGWSYQNNLDTDEAVLGSRKLYALPYGNADYTFTFSARSDMNTFYRLALDADPVDLAFRLTATGVGNDRMVINAYAVQETSAPAPIDGANVLKAIDVSATGHITDDGSQFTDITISNDVASYV